MMWVIGAIVYILIAAFWLLVFKDTKHDKEE